MAREIALFTTGTYAAGSAPTEIRYIKPGESWGLQLNYQDTTPSAFTSTGGICEVDRVTFPTFAGATAGDYFNVTDTSGNTWAVGLRKAVNEYEVNTVTMAAKVACTARDFLHFTSLTGPTAAIWLRTVANVSEIDKLTFADKAGSGAGDYVSITDTASNIWAVGLRTVANRYEANTITMANKAGCTAQDFLHFTTLTGPTTAAVWLRTVAAVKDKNTVTFPAQATAVDGDFFTITDAGGDEWAIALDADGTGVANAGIIWTECAGRQIVVNISADTTATTVAARVVAAITVAFAAKFTVTDVLDGTVIFEAKTAGPCAAVQLKDITEEAVGTITNMNTSPGTTATAAPSNAKITAAGAYVAMADISGATDAPSVAAIVRTATNTLLSSLLTIGAASGAGIPVTEKVYGPATNIAAFQADGTTPSTSASIAETLAGLTQTAEPTGATWTSATAARRAMVDISACTDAASVATAVRAILAGLTSIASVITVAASSGADISITHVAPGPVADPVARIADGTAGGSIGVTETLAGTTATAAPSNAKITAAGANVAMADISGATDANSVAVIVRAAAAALLASLYTVGTVAVGDIPFTEIVYGPATNIAAYQADGTTPSTSASIAETNAGVTQDAEPAGDLWLAATAARRAMADISAATTDIEVCTAARAALVGLTGFTTLCGVSAVGGNPYLVLTHVAHAPVTNPIPKNADDSGAGSIVCAQTVEGVLPTLSVATNTITSVAHGAYTGLKVAATTAGTLPGPLSATDYFIIKLTADTFRLATTLADAKAATPVPVVLLNEGVGVMTLTPTSGGTRSLQVSVSLDGVNFVTSYQVDGAAAVSFAALSPVGSAASKLYEFPGLKNIRAVKIVSTIGDGQLAISGVLSVAK